MRKTTFFLLLFATVMVMTRCNQPAKPAHSEEEMIAAAKAVDAKFVEEINKENLDGVMSCYWNSPDLVVYSPGEMELKGYEATKQSFANFFKDMPGARHEMLGTEYRAAGDIVYCWGKVRLTVPAADSLTAPQTMEGRYTSVFAYKDSGMVYILDHASLPLPPPAEPAPAEAKK